MNKNYQEMGVLSSDANHPVFIFSNDDSPDDFGVTVFQTFTNGPASSIKFDVPKMQCIDE